jgi:large subunit ribosomal protein L10
VKREEKAAVVERLAERMREASALIVADYRGLTVGQVADVRSSLREAGAGFHVSKNTLARIAAAQAGQDALVGLLEGPTAIAFAGDDVPGTAKRLQDAARTTRVLAVRGAVVDGRPLTADDVRRLADLPSREVILSQAVGAVAAPLQATASVIAAPLREVVGLLDAYIAQRQEAEAAA